MLCGMKKIRLVVGLGNPGVPYKGTRHNVGFMVLDELARRFGAEFKKDNRRKAELMTRDGVLFVKPQTFMNDSGACVGPLMRFFKLTPEEVFVVYDETAFAPGVFKIKGGGSAGGHNGIKSLIAHLGTQDFPRLRFGIGPARPGELTGHVLGKFSPEERIIVENGLDKAVEAVQFVLSQGVELAANRYNANEI